MAERGSRPELVTTADLVRGIVEQDLAKLPSSTGRLPNEGCPLTAIRSAEAIRTRQTTCDLTKQVFDADNIINRPQSPGADPMHLTISLDEPLVELLRRRAAVNDISPEQAAGELLNHALRRLADEEAWRESNQRRVVLIGKNRKLGLTEEEICELNRLQTAIDQRLEATDRKLLEVAEEFRQLAERLPDAA